MAKKSQGDAQSDPLPPKNREVACAEGALYFAARSGWGDAGRICDFKGVAGAGGALYLIARSGSQRHGAVRSCDQRTIPTFQFQFDFESFPGWPEGVGAGRKKLENWTKNLKIGFRGTPAGCRLSRVGTAYSPGCGRA